jgi:hypothetical protein
MTIFLLSTLFFCLGIAVFPIITFLSKKINNNRRKQKTSYTQNEVEYLIEQILKNKSNICPFGSPCIVYDKCKTNRIFDRVVNLMKKNIKGPEVLTSSGSCDNLVSGSKK